MVSKDIITIHYEVKTHEHMKLNANENKIHHGFKTNARYQSERQWKS